jgi:hypothetical protein
VEQVLAPFAQECELQEAHPWREPNGGGHHHCGDGRRDGAFSERAAFGLVGGCLSRQQAKWGQAVEQPDEARQLARCERSWARSPGPPFGTRIPPLEHGSVA